MLRLVRSGEAMSRDDDDTLVPELPGRPGYEVTQESRFNDPDAKAKCPECGHFAVLQNEPTLGLVCGLCVLSEKTKNYRPDHRSQMLPRRYHGQREGDVTRAKKQCAKCGHANEGNLRKVGGAYECLNKAMCESMVRVTARLRLVKVDP